MKCGHWGIECVGDFDVRDYAGFIYEVVEVSTGRRYIGRKFFWTNKNKESDWKKYTTSSKIIKGRILEEEPLTFSILELVDSREKLVVREIEILKDLDVLNNQASYYNRTIPAEGYVRDKESYNNPETREKMSIKISAYIEKNGHPLQGKAHPNRGKKLPQTAPKNHVSVDNIIITDGVTNKWFPKDEPIPEGWRAGMTVQRSKDLSEKEIRSRGLVGEINHLAAMERYSRKPSLCRVCGQSIDYARKMLKTCSQECYTSLREEVAKKTFDEDARAVAHANRKTNIAREKGYKSYADFSDALIEYYKTHSNAEVREKFGCSKTQIRYICLAEDFNKHKWVLDNKATA